MISPSFIVNENSFSELYHPEGDICGQQKRRRSQKKRYKVAQRDAAEALFWEY
jgi:hypothetical protein